MNRQVDVKALISHIVKGDGADRCRICMGDTTEGQVYLGDTVMMDGEKPVSLSELLEIITGVEVPLNEVLPSGLCLHCSEAARAAMAFRTTCLEARERWLSTVALLESLPDQVLEPGQKSIFAFIEENKVTVIDLAGREKKKVKKEPLVVKKRKNKINKDLRNDNWEYQCVDCKRKFRYPGSLHMHLLESEQQACFECGDIMAKEKLAQHLKFAHKKKYFPCKKCLALLATKRQLVRHDMTKHGPGTYACPCCGRGFKTMAGCHVHVALHEAKNCPKCDKVFRNLKCYGYHVKLCCDLNLVDIENKVKPEDDKGLAKKKKTVIERDDVKLNVGARGGFNKICYCDYCGKQFRDKKYVCAHIQIVHTKTTHTPCPYCGKWYAAAHMTEHIKKHENKIAPSFTCEHCQLLLKSRLGYEQHIRLHTGEKPFTCKYCPERFSASSRRSEHVRKVHRNPELSLKYDCGKCRAKFRLPYLLKKHMETVHTEKPVWECPECKVLFGTCRGLLHHRRKHQVVVLKS